jgi:hypothetical protein
VATLSRRDAARAFVSLASTTALTALAAPAVAFGRGGHDGSPAPLPRAHAHNDYEHERPLLDALSYGFTSVEADVWLVDGELMVAHDSWDIRPGRTLQALYLDPLLARVRANGGQVYRGHRLSLQLLIDIKNTGEATYLALSRVLRQYRSLFSSAAGDRVRTGPVTAVISGDRAARAPMEAERVRYAFYDGRLDDLAGQTAPASFMPLISGNWTESFTWLGSGTPCGASCSPRAPTTSTPTIWPGSRPFCGAPGADGGAAGHGRTGRSSTQVYRVPFPSEERSSYTPRLWSASRAVSISGSSALPVMTRSTVRPSRGPPS